MFVAQENIRLYIEKFGVNNVGVLTITTPSECLSARQFQEKWHPFRSNVLTKLFPTGMWVRERQPRTGNWHAHAVVNLGWDIRSQFPFQEVERRNYARADPRLRKLWKTLREKAEVYAFGRTELLPIKQNGAGCSVYLTKYLGKALVSDKSEGEERCRLFGIWGRTRFVYGRFDWASNRILRKRKAWLAADSECATEDEFAMMFRPGWWTFMGRELLDVIMPVEFYKVKRGGKLDFDDLGWRAYQEDLQKYPSELNDEEKRLSSLLHLYRAHGLMLYGNSKEALQYAVRRLGVLSESPAKSEIDPQIYLALERAIERTERNCSP